MDADTDTTAIELDRPADAFDIANLLRQIGCSHFLPMVLLKCISGPGVFSTIVAGAMRRDGSWSNLSRENLLACIPAWRSLFQERYDRLRHWCDTVDVDCAEDSICREQITSIMDESIEDMMELRGIFRPWNPGWESRMCVNCSERWKARFELARRDIFDTLPCHFGLPGWDALTHVFTVGRN